MRRDNCGVQRLLPGETTLNQGGGAESGVVVPNLSQSLKHCLVCYLEVAQCRSHTAMVKSRYTYSSTYLCSLVVQDKQDGSTQSASWIQATSGLVPVAGLECAGWLNAVTYNPGSEVSSGHARKLVDMPRRYLV